MEPEWIRAGTFLLSHKDSAKVVQEYMSRQHNVKVSERMAERIKIHVG